LTFCELTMHFLSHSNIRLCQTLNQIETDSSRVLSCCIWFRRASRIRLERHFGDLGLLTYRIQVGLVVSPSDDNLSDILPSPTEVAHLKYRALFLWSETGREKWIHSGNCIPFWKGVLDGRSGRNGRPDRAKAARGRISESLLSHRQAQVTSMRVTKHSARAPSCPFLLTSHNVRSSHRTTRSDRQALSIVGNEIQMCRCGCRFASSRSVVKLTRSTLPQI
jgi:hypothetical protein